MLCCRDFGGRAVGAPEHGAVFEVPVVVSNGGGIASTEGVFGGSVAAVAPGDFVQGAAQGWEAPLGVGFRGEVLQAAGPGVSLEDGAHRF